MALPILDGNQSATTLSTILSSGQHIPAHTVVSLGTQAITDISGAVSGSVVSISNFPATQPVSIASVTIGNTVTIAGTVTASLSAGQAIIGSIDGVNSVLALYDSQGNVFGYDRNFPVDIMSALPAGTNRIGVVTIGAGTVTVGALPALTTNTDFSIVGEDIAQGINAYGTIPIAADWENASQGIGNLNVTATCVTSTNRIGVVTIGGGTVTIGAGTAQIGSVTASISGTVPVSISSVTVGNSITIGSLPAISGTVTANTFALQGTAVTTSNFTSTTASTLLAGYNATREVLTIFNEGAGNLHVCAGATCTTIAYQVRLSAGDYYEVPNHQTTITHSAVFATAGTARVTEVS